LLSLREDYVGELWDWSHAYYLEDAWIQTYRISRLKEKLAYDCIVNPLYKLGIKLPKIYSDYYRRIESDRRGFNISALFANCLFSPV